MAKLKGKAKANARKKARKRQQKKQQQLKTSSRDPRVQGLNVACLLTLGDKIAFCKMLNAFRDEYFKGNSPFDVTPQYLDMVGVDHGIHRNMFYWNDELIAISECGAGMAFGKPTVGVATVYVKPSWRGKGIANRIYHYVETDLMKGIPDCVFNIQIEEEELIANYKKFEALGFTHAYHIAEFSNGLDYQQKTYAVMKGKHFDSALPLKEVA